MCFCESQAVPVGHTPQSSACAQPSPMVPQYWPPANWQVAGVQLGFPHRLATPDPPQVSFVAQALPQSIGRPQPSLIAPQYVPPVGEQLRTEGVQEGSPQTFAVTAPQIWPVGQSPQFWFPPQPSPIAPQY